MKFASLLLFLYCTIISQNLTFLKEFNSSNFGYSKEHINQRLDNITANFASGLLNIDSKLGYHLSYTHLSGSKNSYGINAGLSYKYNEKSGVSISWRNRSIGDYSVNSKLNNQIQLGRLSDNVLTVGYGYKYNEKLNVGLNVLYLRSAILPLEHSYNGETIRKISMLFATLSSQYMFDPENNTHIILTLQNIGGEKAYSVDTPPVSAPTLFHIGASSIIHKSEKYYLYGSTGYSKAEDDKSRIDIGGGIQYQDKYDFHVNYVNDKKFDLNDDYFNIGAGYKESSYKINVNYQTYNKKRTIFGTDQKLTFTIDYYIGKEK